MSETNIFENWVDDPKRFRPFTINRVTNSEMTNLILSYYKGASGSAIDITYGAGTFWRKKLPNWSLEAYDKEPLTPVCKRATWSELRDLLTTDGTIKHFDALFFDPPWLSKAQKSGSGMELNKLNARFHSKGQKASFSEHMKYQNTSSNEVSELSQLFSIVLENEDILVYKNQELQSISGFKLYDYLIQDYGYMPDGFRLSKPKARPNHAFWMIFKKES